MVARSFVPSGGERPAAEPAQPQAMIAYTVQPGDTLFGIAAAFGLLPETILWSNYPTLKDDPDLLAVGVDLLIPPVDGVVAAVEEGDTLEVMARRYQVKPEVVVAEPANGILDINQPLPKGKELFFRGGQRELVVWQLPQPVEVKANTASAQQGAASVKVYRVGACGEVAIPPLGTGAFIYPTGSNFVSGYNFGSYHPGLDFGGKMGIPVYAADSGTVIYAGDSVDAAGRFTGYGRYIVIDHGNGYQTLYAHNSELAVTCGQQVLKGTVIASMGSTGRSTGPHSHFEIRSSGTAINPWSLLP